MQTRLVKTVALLAFTAYSSLALADDPPARVGRVALAQGQVSIGGDSGEPPAAALVNWPVTSHNTITTAKGARTELRIGSTSVRLDGGSALEVSELDDDSLHLHLHYGSASIRIVNPEVLAGFELTTPQARVRMQEPGRVRIDAERRNDSSSIDVFDGVAQVEAAGSQLTVRAGRRAEVDDGDVRTAQASRDAFDDWAWSRDQYEDRSRSSRYIGTEMTGYEDLDRYGNWQTDAEYGSLWFPVVAQGWVPYRDGRWCWVDPWGWTWVDNSPWGYAPFHYGRWVEVHNRWAWAPGRHHQRPVWAPALVGWVGGGGWSVAFGRQSRPAQGWYPLSPHDRFEPGYGAPAHHLHSWNDNVRPDRRRGRDYRPHGLTVVPHDEFGRRHQVEVRNAPKVTMPPPVMVAQGAPAAAAPPPPQGARQPRGPGSDGTRDWRRDGRAEQRRDDGRFERGERPPTAMPAPVAPVVPRPTPLGPTPVPRTAPLGPTPLPPAPPVAMPPQPAPLTTAPPVPPAQQWQRRHEAREAFEDGRRQRDMPAMRRWEDARPPQAVAPAPAPAMPAPMLQTSPPPNPADAGFGRGGRGRGDGDFDRHRREPAPAPAQPQPQPERPAPPQQQQQPAAHAAPPPAAAPAQASHGNPMVEVQRRAIEERKRQQER